MNQKQLKTLWATFQKLFKATTPEESITVLQQHPELLTDVTHCVSKLLKFRAIM